MNWNDDIDAETRIVTSMLVGGCIFFLAVCVCSIMALALTFGR